VKKRNPKYDAAYELYKMGYSLEQVADKVNVTRKGIYKAFKLRGFELRAKNFQVEQIFDGKKFTLRPRGYFALTTDDRMLMHRYVWEFHNGKIPEGFDVHHTDFNKWNNEIGNLECLPKSEHTKKYSPFNNQFTKGRKVPGKCKL